MPVALQFSLVLLVLLAGIYDWRFRRIPNWLSLCGLATGICLNIVFFGWHGCGSAFLGTVAALVVYLPLYALRGMAAGDVKLMAAVGAITGPGDWLIICLVTALAGGLVSIVFVLYKGRLFPTFLNLLALVSELCHLRVPAREVPSLDVRNEQALRLPHAVPIALGSLLFLSFSAG